MGARKPRKPIGPRAGPAKCLRCGRKFPSVDVTRNRICPKCTALNYREYIPRQSPTTFYTDGGPQSLPSDE